MNIAIHTSFRIPIMMPYTREVMWYMKGGHVRLIGDSQLALSSCLSVSLSPEETRDLSRMHAASHPVTSGISSSPTESLNWVTKNLDGWRWMNGILIKQYICAHHSLFLTFSYCPAKHYQQSRSCSWYQEVAIKKVLVHMWRMSMWTQCSFMLLVALCSHLQFWI